MYIKLSKYVYIHNNSISVFRYFMLFQRIAVETTKPVHSCLNDYNLGWSSAPSMENPKVLRMASLKVKFLPTGTKLKLLSDTGHRRFTSGQW